MNVAWFVVLAPSFYGRFKLLDRPHIDNKNKDQLCKSRSI
jgi:hypothetical protein